MPLSKDERVEKTRELIESGSTQAEAAKELGVSLSTIQNDLRPKAKTVSEKAKDTVKSAAKAVSKAVVGSKIPHVRQERRAAQGQIIKHGVLGTPCPRSLRIHLYDRITGKKAIGSFRMQMIDAGLEIEDGAKLDALIADHMERIEIEYGSQG